MIISSVPDHNPGLDQIKILACPSGNVRFKFYLPEVILN